MVFPRLSAKYGGKGTAEMCASESFRGSFVIPPRISKKKRTKSRELFSHFLSNFFMPIFAFIKELNNCKLLFPFGLPFDAQKNFLPCIKGIVLFSIYYISSYILRLFSAIGNRLLQPRRNGNIQACFWFKKRYHAADRLHHVRSTPPPGRNSFFCRCCRRISLRTV